MRVVLLVASLMATSWAGCLGGESWSTIIGFGSLPLDVDQDMVLPGNASFEASYFRSGVELDGVLLGFADESRLRVTANDLPHVGFASYGVWMRDAGEDYGNDTVYVGRLQPDGDVWSIEVSYQPPRFPMQVEITIEQDETTYPDWVVFGRQGGGIQQANNQETFLAPKELARHPEARAWGSVVDDEWTVEEITLTGLDPVRCGGLRDGCSSKPPWVSYCAWLLGDASIAPRFLECWKHDRVNSLEELSIDCVKKEFGLVVSAHDAADPQPDGPSPLRLMETPACPSSTECRAMWDGDCERWD